MVGAASRAGELSVHCGELEVAERIHSTASAQGLGKGLEYEITPYWNQQHSDVMKSGDAAKAAAEAQTNSMA